MSTSKNMDLSSVSALVAMGEDDVRGGSMVDTVDIYDVLVLMIFHVQE
jgi:hypothetical protein